MSKRPPSGVCQPTSAISPGSTSRNQSAPSSHAESLKGEDENESWQESNESAGEISIHLHDENVESEDEASKPEDEGPKVLIVRELPPGEDSSPDEESSEDDDERWRTLGRGADVPSEYWHIQKLIKYIKVGNQTATVVALACLKEQDLTKDVNQLAIRDIGGMEVLVNLLEVKDFKCKLGALFVLRAISTNIDCSRAITDLGGVVSLCEILDLAVSDLQLCAAQTIANVCRLRKARKIVRKAGGIPKLVDLLDIPEKILTTPMASLSHADQQLVELTAGSARALWSLSTSRANKEAMRKSGVVVLLAKLLRAVHEDVVVPALGTVQQCATEANFQLAIQTEGMIPDLVSFLNSSNVELQKHGAAAIFKCAEDEHTRNVVRENNGLESLVKLVSNVERQTDKPLMAAVTGAIWKCAGCPPSTKKLVDLNAVGILAKLLTDPDREVVTHVVGALAELSSDLNARNTLRSLGALEPLILLLNMTHPPLLRNTAKALTQLAADPQCTPQLEELDVMRLLWSQLKSEDADVQAEAAWALCPCITNATDSGEMVRSLVGGLELIVCLLNSDNKKVLAAVCATIANVAKDRENLAVITDHGVVPLLARLVPTTAPTRGARGRCSCGRCGRNLNGFRLRFKPDEEDDLALREQLGAAIANCCTWGNNCHEFGSLGAVCPLVGYLAGPGPQVHRTAALALHRLSADPYNCVTMHHAGVVPYLLETIGSADEVLQEASAGCLSNIRKMALSAEKFKLQKRTDC